MTRLEISGDGVVRNGLDYLESSVEHLLKGTDKDLKYSVLHLFAGMETLVKARLMREHWTLVVAETSVPSKSSFITGDFKSVGITSALQRLRNVADVSLDDKWHGKIKAVEKLRNRAAHFSLQGETKERVSAVVARGVNFMLHFIQEEMLPKAPASEAELIDATLETLRQFLGKSEALVKERMNTLTNELSRHSLVLKCSGCLQASYILDSAVESRCLYCLYRAPGEQAAFEYVESILRISNYEVVKDGGEWPLHRCVSCSDEALVSGVHSAAGEEVGYVCFACGSTYSADEISWCDDCLEPKLEAFDDTSICSDCLASRYDRY